MTHILIADDNIHTRNALKTALQVFGFDHIETVVSGEEVLALWEHTKPDVIILDYFMPGLDGLATTRRIRQVDLNVPVILLSGSFALKTEEVLQAGVTVFLTKDVHIATLVNTIQSISTF